MGNCTVMAIANQKGGVGKTTTTANLGIGLANIVNGSESEKGKTHQRVLVIDSDPQSSLTLSLGYNPEEISVGLPELFSRILRDEPIVHGEGILHHPEGIDLLPTSIALAGTEVSLVNAMSRESILKQLVNEYRKDYDHILIDCMPSLGMLTINALAAADRVLIPVQTQYLSAKGLEQLLQTIAKVRRQINPHLKIDGILLTMVDSRTNNAKEISSLLRETYGEKIRIYAAEIPRSVRAAEISAEGKSIFEHDPGGKVAEAYRLLTKEVMTNEQSRQKVKPDPVR